MDFYMQYYAGSQLDDDCMIEEEPPERWRNEIEEDDGWGDVFK